MYSSSAALVCVLSLVVQLQHTTPFEFGGVVRVAHMKARARDEILIGRRGTQLALDLQDILDDEVDFLAQLRRQVDGSSPVTKASPREVTNRIKSFFSGGRRPPEEVSAFRAYLQSNGEVLDVVNAVLLIEGCDRSGVPTKELCGWSDLLSAMDRPSPLLTSGLIYRGISVLRRMRSDDGFSKNYLSSLLRRIEESSMVLHGTDICPSIYALQAFSANMPEVRALLAFLTKSLASTNVALSSKSVCAALFGLKRMRAVPEVRALLQQLAVKIASSESYFHSVNVCIGLNGLQFMDDSTPEVRAVMKALIGRAIPAEEQGVDQVTDREISMALFGVQRMGQASQGQASLQRDKEVSPELRQVVRYVSSLVAHNKNDFEAKRVCLCLLGLSGLSSDLPEVRALMLQLAGKAKTAWGELSGQELSMGLHGLAGARSEHPEALRLLGSLMHLVKKCPAMSAQDAASALVGLQGLRSRANPEVAALSAELAELLQRSNVTLTAHQTMQSLYGLQGLSSSAPEVRRLLRAVARSVCKGGPASSLGDLDGRDVAQGVYGCRSLNSQNEETLELLARVTPILEAYKGRLSGQNVGTALYGLQKMRADNKPVRRLLATLTPLVRAAEGSMSSKSVSMALNGLQGLSSGVPEVAKLVEALAVLLEKSEASFAGFESFHEVSAAMAGTAGLSAEAPEVYRLLCSLARLVEKTDMKKMAAAEQMVKGERVALALFGLQGCSAKTRPARDLLGALREPIRGMTALRGKEVGMALQGFKECAGTPSPEHAAVLEILSTKLAGWAGPRRRSNSDLEITLRSALWGMSKLDRKHPAVRSVLVALAAEIVESMKQAEGAAAGLDPKTVNSVREVYRGGNIEADETVAAMMAVLGISARDTTTVSSEAAPVPRWTKKPKASAVPALNEINDLLV